MNPAVLDALFFLGLIVGAVYLARVAVRRFTDIGKAAQLADNTHAVERLVDQTCPVHGFQEEATLVVGDDGQPQCPICYQNALERAQVAQKAARADSGK